MKKLLLFAVFFINLYPALHKGKISLHCGTMALADTYGNEMPGDPGGGDPGDPGNPGDPGSGTDDGGNDSECATSVTFAQAPTSKYGFDDYSNASSPWISVNQGDFENVSVSIASQDGGYNSTAFKSLATGIATVSPLTANAATMSLQINGIGHGISLVQANCTTSNNTIGSLNVASYPYAKKKIAVRVVNSASHTKSDGTTYPGYTSTGIDASSLQSYLSNCYKQAISDIDIIQYDNITVDFDLNSDGKIEVSTTGSLTSEEQVIANNYTVPGCNATVFLVSNPSTTTADAGQSQNGASIIFDINGEDKSYVITHEVGHSAWGLTDLGGDTDNLMHDSYISGNLQKLRKFQWDIIHQ